MTLPHGNGAAMMIDVPDPEAPATKEMKVVIPARLHLRLHSVKVLTGKQISQTITEALDAYFADAAR